ncbi:MULTISPECIES: hypothetical protein [unclassified Paenibacillus]|uniref:hypothetical protein n=1 Tax=Paenibacillus TaxID=44249 RepID=UPI001162F163|nr:MULTISPECIES: hypothetical protein [unclassified Paenibacillus]AWP29463.1 hypothetical protein B9D94_23875 [Paenibacillus sp. Cedars]MDH6674102.1 hypothetical protein [Paenibacillus sp. LBL]
MNKMLLIVITAATLLTACQSNPADNDGNATGNNEQSAQTETSQQNNESAEESLDHGAWSALPEYDVIVRNIDSQDYTFRTVTDNKNERILLLTNPDGEEKYKTIFIKNTSRLKIIDVDGGGQLFNDILENS